MTPSIGEGNESEQWPPSPAKGGGQWPPSPAKSPGTPTSGRRQSMGGGGEVGVPSGRLSRRASTEGRISVGGDGRRSSISGRKSLGSLLASGPPSPHKENERLHNGEGVAVGDGR